MCQEFDPVALLRHIDRLQDALWPYAYRERVITLDGDEAADSLAETKRAGLFQRPSSMSQQTAAKPATPDQLENPLAADRPKRLYRQQKNKYKGVRWWRTHPDAFAEVWPEVVQQLQQTPDLQAKVLFQMLQRRHPGQFKDSQLRTFQRHMRVWRRQTLAAPPTSKDGY